MSLLLDPDQLALRDAVRDFLDANSAPSRVRAVMDTADGFDRTLWRRMSAELGLAGLNVPEQYGGSAAGYQTRSVVLEELGSHLTVSPYFSTAVLAVDTLVSLDDEEARAKLLPGIASGELLVAVAFTEDGDPAWRANGLSTVANWDGTQWSVTGRKALVIDGLTAHHVIVSADSDSGLRFFLVDAAGSGVRREGVAGIDLTRALARYEFDAAPAVELTAADPVAALERIRDLTSLALCAEMLGGLRRCVDMTVAYSKIRFQFGRAIGSFQAVKHRCADMYSRLELGTAALRQANAVADAEGAELPVLAATVHAELARSYRWTADDTIHLHGGIGFTWDHDSHLYLRRAVSSGWLFGDSRYYFDRLAERLRI